MASNFLALDIGEVRVGGAMARSDVRVPVALATLMRSAEDFWQQLLDLIKQHEIGTVILGLPRGLDGQETAQTAYARSFAAELVNHTTIPIIWQDEALTSVKAETTLKQANKQYVKADIDALAACYILNDYLEGLS